jgi:hypothetical protein
MEKRGKCLLCKKAQTNEVYHILIQVIIAVTIFLILQAYISSVAKDTLFEKSYLSKDIALLIESIYTSPGEVTYTYAHRKAELDRFQFEFDEQKVSVRETGVEEEITVEYPYAEDLNFPSAMKRISGATKIEFSKKGGKVEVR